MTPLRSFWTAIAAAAAGLALAAAGGLFAPLDAVALDTFFRLRGERPASEEIVLVAIDEAFLEAYQTRIGDLDRRFVARAVDALDTAGARAIGIDLFFPEPTESDAELAAAVTRADAVLPHVPAAPLGGGAVWRGTAALSLADRVPYNPLLRQARRGAVSLEPDGRRFRPELAFRDGTLPSFPLALALRAGHTPSSGATAETLQQRRLIDYRGAQPFTTLSLLDVVRGDFAFAQVQDKIVLLGVNALGATDRLVTPFGSMPGVEVNASALATLLDGGPSELPPLPLALLTLASGVLAGAAGGGRRARWIVPLAAALLLGGAATLFAAGVFVPPTGPLLALLAGAALGAVAHVRALDQRLGRALADLLGTAGALRSGDRAAPARAAAGNEDDSAAATLEALRRTVGARSAVLLDGELSLRSGADDALLERTAAAAAGRIAPLLPPEDPADDLPHLALPLPGARRGAPPQGALAVAFDVRQPDGDAVRLALRAVRDARAQLRRYETMQRRVASLDAWPWQLRSLHSKADAVARVAQLLTLHERWRQGMLDGVSLPLIVAEPSGRILYRNAAAAALFGSPDDLVGALTARLRLPETRVREDVLAALAGSALELITAERAGGRPRLLTLRAVALDPGVLSLVGVLGDLRALSETERRRDEVVSLLIHDVRGGLSNMLGLAEQLDHDAKEKQSLGPTSDRGRDRSTLTLLRQEAANVLEVIEGLPLATRVETPAVALDPRPFDLALRLREAVGAAGLAAARKGIALAIAAPGTLEATLDRALVGRAVDNLLSNAIKYSAAGSRVSVQLIARAGERLEISVADEGYGLAPEQQQRVFERDYRVADDPHGAERGSGLGLYVVRQVAEAHGGSVRLDSEPGRGSTFTLELPRRVAAAERERRT